MTTDFDRFVAELQQQVIEQARAVYSDEDLIDALDGLPEESVHCAQLAVNTLREAIASLRAEGST